jgi:class 3 adenylate cyclase
MPVFWIISVIMLINIIGAFFYFKQRKIKLENIRLEGMVQARTSELAAEKDKSDQLLRAILPDKIADELKDDVHSVAEAFPDVTLLFSDIVSFTKVSSNHTASEIVSALNDLFTRFDERAKRMGVEKIKTIGDAYMAACGIPTSNPDHAKIMVDFARGMYSDLEDYNKIANIKFNMRIGLNCGPVTAGVIGKTKFAYDVWGNTVNVASRMESACNPGEIRVSQMVYEQLKDSDVKFTAPIECEIKGKGKMTTYEIVK